MPQLSKLNYNYRVVKQIKENDRYKKTYDKLFSQLKDIQIDFPTLTVKDLRYLARNDSICRTEDKYKGLSITKVFPIPICGISHHRESETIKN